MNNENLRIPIAIIIAGVLVAGAVYLSNSTPRKENSKKNEVSKGFTNIRPLSATEHIVGNPEANIVFVEYSDTECPYCKMFHTTMNKVVTEYAKDGKVAWAYRHMPLHSKSQKESEAIECVGSLGGEVAYWKMLNSVYEASPGNDGLDLATLPKIAVASGVSESDFNTCLSSGKMTKRVEADYQDAIVAEATGTPHSVIILKNPLTDETADKLTTTFAKLNIGISENKKMLKMSGAMPYDVVKMIIEVVLNDK